jgi:type I restriction enzyme M protein
LLFGSTSAHKDLRRKLVEEFEPLAVVSLPAGVFKPYAGVKTGVLVFRKPLLRHSGESRNPEGGSWTPASAGVTINAKRLDKVWFYEVANDGYDPDKISGGGRVETPDRNDIPDLLKQWKAYKASKFFNPPGVEAGTLLESGSEMPRCWWATLESIEANDYNLAAGRYKPQVAELIPENDPVEMIRDTLAIEKEITEGLERLMKELETIG